MIDGDPVGEVWVTGDDATLDDGQALAGAGLAARVPLVKLLDVAGTLSVQVHPDDTTAVALRGSTAIGKHECWVVLEAPAGAAVALGLRDGATEEDLFSRDEERIVRALRRRPVVAGTVLDIPPGTVHAPAGGLILYEVQQRSDLTFRIWDWGRPRPLQVEESRQSLRLDAAPAVAALPERGGVSVVSVPAAPFRLESWRLRDGDKVAAELAQPAVLSVIDGSLASKEAVFQQGTHWLLPAGPVTVTGTGHALVATLALAG
jgi:mannose-6-phosphate isomerase